MIYKQIKLALVGLMALAVAPLVAGAVIADSGSGTVGAGSNDAEMFLGFGACPGAPCADVELSLNGGSLNARADGFGFPLDNDGTGTLNRYALCVDGIFIGDDQVKSKNRRVVQDDGVVDISGDAAVTFTTLLTRVVTIVDIGDAPPSIGMSDASCTTGMLLLRGTVGFRNLR